MTRWAWYTGGGREWIQACRRRDGFKCRKCGKKPRRVEVHHIWAFEAWPSMRSVPENGLTLCKKCHAWVRTDEGRAWNEVKMSEVTYR